MTGVPPHRTRQSRSRVRTAPDALPASHRSAQSDALAPPVVHVQCMQVWIAEADAGVPIYHHLSPNPLNRFHL